jgi:hypothetical protein
VQNSVNMATFWANAGLPGGAGGDQRVLFDHYTNRWIVSGFGSSGSLINIAVSQTANALGPWQSTQFVGYSPGLSPPAGFTRTGSIADYPTLSMNNQGVVIGTNNFTTYQRISDGANFSSFDGTSLFVIPKTSLFGGAPSTTGLTTFATTNAGPDNGFAIQGAVNWFNGATTTMAVQADSRIADAQVFYKVNGVNAAGATQTASAQIAGSGYTPAGPGRQPDGTRTVDTLSPRITGNVVEVNGVLYSAITVDDGTGHAAVRWSAVNAASGALIEQGLISGGLYDYYEGSISVNEFGEAVIGYNRSGFQTADGNGDGLADGNISFMGQAFKVDAGGGLDLYGSEMLFRVSATSNYHCTGAGCRERWGDYSAVTFDPTDHHTFYAIGEYTSGNFVIPGFTTTERSIWNTFIARVAFVPEPGTYLLVLLGLALAGVSTRRRQGTAV